MTQHESLVNALENVEYDADALLSNAKGLDKEVTNLRYAIEEIEDESEKIEELEGKNSDLEDRVAELEEELEAMKVELDNVLVNPS